MTINSVHVWRKGSLIRTRTYILVLRCAFWGLPLTELEEEVALGVNKFDLIWGMVS